VTQPGKIMLLQGPSSAGKSTLASALQLILDDYWLQLGADDVSAMQPGCQPPGWWEPSTEERPHPSWRPEVRLERWLARYWASLATIARTGDNVIAAGGWLRTEWLVQAAYAFDGIDAICVGVYCPLEECERREIARGDRGVGYARSQFDVIFEHAPFDIDVDTFAMSIQEAADHIKASLSTLKSPLFFDRVRSRYSAESW